MASQAVEKFVFAHMLSISPMIQRYQNWSKQEMRAFSKLGGFIKLKVFSCCCPSLMKNLLFHGDQKKDFFPLKATGLPTHSEWEEE